MVNGEGGVEQVDRCGPRFSFGPGQQILLPPLAGRGHRAQGGRRPVLHQVVVQHRPAGGPLAIEEVHPVARALAFTVRMVAISALATP